MSETKTMTVQAHSLEIVRPVATAADVVGAHKAVTELIQGALVEGEVTVGDYASDDRWFQLGEPYMRRENAEVKALKIRRRS